MSTATEEGAIVRIGFGPFTLDLDTRQLMEGVREIHVEPKAFELLSALITNAPKVISKSELQKHLWPDTFVAEANLSNLVAEIREALGDRARAPRFIRTAHGFGYAFCGETSPVAALRTPIESHQPPCWLEWGTQRIPLSLGEHIIGRDPDLDVTLEHSTVSRRHARLVVSLAGALLEDFGSKNGTFRGGQRVTAPIQLADGDAIHVGSLLVTFRVRAPLMSTDTQVTPAP